jgi:Protein of unknown function (DUF732)
MKSLNQAHIYRSAVSRRMVLATIIGALMATATPLPCAYAVPAPEVEFVYDVAVRRHYNFPGNDAVGYGHIICDKVTAGRTYAQVMGDVKNDVSPNDEFASNYLVANAVNILCPEQIWQLRNSAAGYQTPSS